jgi:hypothetical protein
MGESLMQPEIGANFSSAYKVFSRATSRLHCISNN